MNFFCIELYRVIREGNDLKVSQKLYSIENIYLIQF